jgi:hypothetical protein
VPRQSLPKYLPDIRFLIAAIYFSEVEHVRVLGPFISFLLLFPLLTAAQERDPHFLTPRIAPTAHKSTFIHGYLHGYEEGFHEADFDLHLGRPLRADERPKLAGYRHEFGAKKMYESGFREGYRVGYADAATGRNFRAIQNVVDAREADDSSDVRESLPYDEAVRMGYVAGQKQGLNDARGQHEASPSPSCPVSGNGKQEFCPAYARGFGIGYADGFANQTKMVVAEAK